MTVEERFERVADRLMSRDSAIERGKMMHAIGLKTSGKFFAMTVDGDLVVKLPAERVAGLLEDGSGRPFGSGGRQMREWVRLAPADDAACEAVVLEAQSFVGD